MEILNRCFNGEKFINLLQEKIDDTVILVTLL